MPQTEAPYNISDNKYAECLDLKRSYERLLAGNQLPPYSQRFYTKALIRIERVIAAHQRWIAEKAKEDKKHPEKLKRLSKIRF